MNVSDSTGFCTNVIAFRDTELNIQVMKLGKILNLENLGASIGAFLKFWGGH